MIVINNTYYNLTIESGKQYITNKIAGLGSLTIELYDFTDTAFTTALVSEILDFDDKYNIITEDGRFNLVIKYNDGVDDIVDVYEYVIFKTFKDGLITEFKNALCNCSKPQILSNCTNCSEDDKNLDSFSTLTYMFSHLYLFSYQDNAAGLAAYIHNNLYEQEAILIKRFEDIFGHKLIHGTYTYNFYTTLLYYTIIYLYLYNEELLQDTNQDFVDTKYDIVNIKECIKSIGLKVSEIIENFSTFYERGRCVTLSSISGVSDYCLDVPEINVDLNTAKDVFTSDLQVDIVSTSKYLLFVLPSSWGEVTSITDAGGGELLTDLTLHNCGDKNIYVFNYILPPNTYNFKFVF